MDNTGLIYDKSRNSRSPKAEIHVINMLTSGIYVPDLNFYVQL
jgi:hypothetical protein